MHSFLNSLKLLIPFFAMIAIAIVAQGNNIVVYLVGIIGSIFYVWFTDPITLSDFTLTVIRLVAGVVAIQALGQVSYLVYVRAKFTENSWMGQIILWLLGVLCVLVAIPIGVMVGRTTPEQLLFPLIEQPLRDMLDHLLAHLMRDSKY